MALAAATRKRIRKRPQPARAPLQINVEISYRFDLY